MASLGSNSPIASQLLVDLKRGAGVSLHRQVETGAARGDPLRSIHGGNRASPHPDAGRRARRLARRRRRGLLATRGRGLPDESPGRLHPRRCGSRPAVCAAGAGGPGQDDRARDRLRLRPRQRRRLPSPGLAALGSAGAERGARTRASAIRTGRARARCARRSPTISTASGARWRDRRIWSSPTATRRGSRCCSECSPARGARRLAVEDPSANDDARLIAAQLGIELIGVPVDGDGVRIDALERLRADALILTPSHQWPTGAVLSAEAPCGGRCLGTAHGRADRRGRLRRRVPLRPRPDRSDPGSRPRPGGVCGDGEQDAGARLPARLVRPAARPARAVRRRQAARRPWFAGDRPADLHRLPAAGERSTATCAGCARSTTSVVTRSSLSLAGGCRSCDRAGSPLGCTSSRGCPTTFPRPRWWTPPRRRGLAIAGVGPYRLVPVAQGGLIFGYSDLSTSAIRRGVRLLEAAVQDVSGAAG